MSYIESKLNHVLDRLLPVMLLNSVEDFVRECCDEVES